ncbi:HupE/UreJ family protein [Microbulbifer echini]|uniref:HupE/UreJ family protein n=1 Tax=Microbulbifer echini TaxID=1529067 RepID=A0ABV4NN42_9GAMM|nr:HupE/UreJ family protein [uncultured Microbulbifer sp.]
MPNRHLYQNSLIFLATLLGVAFSNLGFTHDGRPVYIELQERPENQYILRWKIPPVMQPGTEPEVYLTGDYCQILPETQFFSRYNTKKYQCQPSLSQTNTQPDERLIIKIGYPVANPALSTLIRFEQMNGGIINLFNGPEAIEIHLPSELSIWQYVRQYIEAGFLHILEGYDHLLFVFCLVYIARNLKGITIAVTGFTLGHSLTLGLASLNVFSVRVDIVEVLIPLSIMVLAAEIVNAGNHRHKETLAWRFPAIVASGFGLLHGFGFASALAELGLPHNQKITALISFNIGVELGQLIFVLLLLFLAYMAKLAVSKWKFSEITNHILTQSKYAIYLVGIASGYWVVSRSLEVIY